MSHLERNNRKVLADSYGNSIRSLRHGNSLTSAFTSIRSHSTGRMTRKRVEKIHPYENDVDSIQQIVQTERNLSLFSLSVSASFGDQESSTDSYSWLSFPPFSKPLVSVIPFSWSISIVPKVQKQDRIMHTPFQQQINQINYFKFGLCHLRAQALRTYVRVYVMWVNHLWSTPYVRSTAAKSDELCKAEVIIFW